MQAIGTLLGLVALVLIITGIIGNRKRKKRGEKKNKQTWIGIAVFILAIIITPTTSDEASAEKESTPTEEATEEVVEEEPAEAEEEAKEEAAKEEEKEEEEEESAEVSIEDRLKSIAADEFASVDTINYDKDSGFVLIKAKGKDNLTTNMTRKSWYMAQLDVLESLQNVEGVETVDFNILTTLVDQFGNEEDEIAMKTSFSKDTRDKINFDKVLFDNLPNIADEYWHHPAVEK